MLQILPHASKRRSGGPGRGAAKVARLRLGRFNHATKRTEPAKAKVRHRQQHPARLATLNVGTLIGRSRELADSLRKRRVDICCVQETRWKGSKSREFGDGYKLIYHGTSNRNGVGIILNESFRNSVTAVDRLSDRLMAVKVDTGEVELRVVSAYAPQAGCSEEEKASFWEDLEQYVQSLQGEEVLLIGGDFNELVGSRKDGFESCHDGYGYGARNDDGLRKKNLEYAVASDLIIANTQYRKRKSHLITYTRGGRETQIDFWMLRRRDRRLLQDSKVIPTDHVAAQHHLLAHQMVESEGSKGVRARHRSTLDMEHTKIVKGADGVPRRSGQILERWREYYNHLCNEEFCHPPIPTVPSVEGPVLPITAVEVSAALAKIKSNNATGPDDIPADVWKLLGDRGSVWLATLFNKIVAE
ncbi:hypothetical protein RB195_025170 [Necator americanus]|uniref:Endonuclease/exonuclease/phosphatase domain-containing protein n=1 Tax=Necator americanus TaxID=51031 RepID=A0ABR1ER49_NECAM